MAKSLTTDDVNGVLFRPHGRLEFTCKESLVHISAIGPFNQEVIHAVGVIEPEMLREISNKYGSWSEIIVYENSCVYSPEGLIALEEYINQLVVENISPKYSAFVIAKDVEGQAMMSKIYSAIYERCGVNMRVFESEKEALFWIKEKN